LTHSLLSVNNANWPQFQNRYTANGDYRKLAASFFRQQAEIGERQRKPVGRLLRKSWTMSVWRRQNVALHDRGF
jgi:hypothetical protein